LNTFTLDSTQNKTVVNLFTQNNTRVYLSQQMLFEHRNLQQHKFVQSTYYLTIFFIGIRITLHTVCQTTNETSKCKCISNTSFI